MLNDIKISIGTLILKYEICEVLFRIFRGFSHVWHIYEFFYFDGHIIPNSNIILLMCVFL